MRNEEIIQLQEGLETAFINRANVSNLAYKPQFISNNYKEGRKVISSIESELLACEEFFISVAFITMGGITPLLQTFRELEARNIKGCILTTDYLHFSDPRALEKLAELSNITVKMYMTEEAGEGFHTKGYAFRRGEIYRIIVGSSNLTMDALTKNREWNSKIVSTDQGEYAEELIQEFHQLWESPYAVAYDDFIDTYKTKYRIIQNQRKIAKDGNITSIEQYRLQPNSMQTAFIANLKKICDAGENKALLISATGTGKTFASAFAMRELGFSKVLFLVHRVQLAQQTKKSYERVFGNTVSMEIIGGGKNKKSSADYVFATVQTLNKEKHMHEYGSMEFDCIVLDEAHHSSANTYQKIMQYFKPKLWLGMTATPDKREEDVDGRNIYEIFNYQIAYEIRLQQAMEENLLCPFHYFGISDLAVISDDTGNSGKLSSENFRLLTSDERVRHIIEQIKYYGYSGSRVKGLIFCSRIEESRELSDKFNALGYRTIALNGDASEEKRTEAFERLAMEEADATEEMQPLDYIFSVDILNEGVDIVEVNQVVMLRPTQSPIIFIQQLGRGLRKANGKEYVVILDFIGNYNKNFMIPIALSGDRSYNADTIRKYVISGNNTIPGASTVHFDEISKEKIFHSIDKMRGMKAIIRESYATLKNRLGRIPYLMDFYENGEVDPLVIIREYKTYPSFLASVEAETFAHVFSDQEMLTLEYLSKTILSGVRPHELVIMKQLLQQDSIVVEELIAELNAMYPNVLGSKASNLKVLDSNTTNRNVLDSNTSNTNMLNPNTMNSNILDSNAVSADTMKSAIWVLQGGFVSKEEERQKYSCIEILEPEREGNMQRLQRVKSYAKRLEHLEFAKQVKDLISVGLCRYRDKYADSKHKEGPFVMYEKYSRRDVCLLMNCDKDLSSTMYGMKLIGDDVFIFVTYHKETAEEGKNYVDGKPDYADTFVDNMTFLWDSQIGKGPDSPYMKQVCGAKRKHLLVKKSDAETNFYYLGTFSIIQLIGAKKTDNQGKEKDITKVTMRMDHTVRDDLLRYFRSCIEQED